MFQITLEGPIDGFGAIPALLNTESVRWLDDMSEWITSDLKQRVPVKTGQLRDSIRAKIERRAGGGEATFFSVFYGSYVDEGTASYNGGNWYTIMPVNAKALHFWNRNGEEVFAASVRHPGVKPRNFTMGTLEEAEKEADQRADSIAERIFGMVSV